jgi:hypothetical protein
MEESKIADALFWKTSGVGGLELTVINSLDAQRHDLFDLVVNDWDLGDPDALSQISASRPRYVL